jgi:FAD/FMN-containing dehydrogenase
MKRRQFIGTGVALAAAWPLRSLAAILKDVGDVAAKSLDGGDLMLRGSSVEAFAADLRGDLLLPADPAYDARRRVWNGMVDRKPALIACCTGAADVRKAVDFAREHGLLTAVRSGGHSLSGKCTCDGGLVIDLQAMQGVRVDPEQQRAYLEAGSLLGQLDHETAAFGLATTAGTVSDTGAAGLTLGGGFGRLGRRFGLACDNVASFDLVTADGRFRRASDEENPDLFWGLRGGGGNFGVVTSIEYRLHPVDPVVLGGYVAWPLDRARDAMRLFRDIAPSAPDVVNLMFDLHWEDTEPLFGVEICWSGDHVEGEEWLKALRAFGKPVVNELAPVPYLHIQSKDDALYPRGGNYYLKSGFITQLADADIDVILDMFRRTPTQFAMFADHCGAAYARVAADATAFPRRDMSYVLALVATWQDATESEAWIDRARTAWHGIEPMTAGFYTNYAAGDTKAASYRDNYGPNLEQLMALKSKYDPRNLFRLNANVLPKI